LGALAIGWPIYRRVGIPLALAGARCSWWRLGLAAMLAMPGAASFVLAPLVPVVALLLAASVVKSQWAGYLLLVGTLAIAVNQE
jgi:hypothetical protein